MLRRLSADDPRFRAVTFRPGMNLLVADTRAGSAETDSRNGTGKSSLVELLHFLLGAAGRKGALTQRPALRDTAFRLSLDMPGSDHAMQVARQGARQGVVATDHPQVVGSSGHLVATGAAEEIPLAAWCSLLERELFRLPTEHPGISGRAMLSLLMRRVGAHAFNDPVRTFPRQSEAEAAANLAYLLGLDWRLAGGYREIAARESIRKQMRAAMNDPVWGRVVGSTADLRGKIIVAEADVERLEREIREFRVVPAYEELKRRADELDRRVRALPDEDVVDRRNLADLRRAVAETNDPDTGYLETVYQELGIALPEHVRRPFEDVRGFHQSVLRNRRRYLSEEIAALEQRLAEREQERERLGRELAGVLETLQAGGALDGLVARQRLLAQKQAALEALRKQYETAQILETSQREITAKRTELQQALETDLEERAEQTREATLLFSRFARRLYGEDRDAYLRIKAGTHSLKITTHVDSGDSTGIHKMVIFCLDLTTAVLAYRHGRGPGFLVHDSHLFDGVDERQVTAALTLAAEVARQEGLQYLALFNSDVLEQVRTRGFEPSPYMIEPRLTDEYEEGGLFGFRF